MLESKALVEIKVPAINKSYDTYIPLDCKMSSILRLLMGTIKELSDSYLLNQDTVLCDYKSGQIFDLNKTVTDLDIKNGSVLLLM